MKCVLAWIINVCLNEVSATVYIYIYIFLYMAAAILYEASIVMSQILIDFSLGDDDKHGGYLLC